MIARSLLLFCWIGVAQAQQCPHPASGYTAPLTGDPQYMIYDFDAQQDTFIFQSGATHTFVGVPAGLAQTCAATPSGPGCFSAAGGYPQLVLNRQWSCPIQTMAQNVLYTSQSAAVPCLYPGGVALLAGVNACPMRSAGGSFIELAQ